jgi:hypothetical protein
MHLLPPTDINHRWNGMQIVFAIMMVCAKQEPLGVGDCLGSSRSSNASGIGVMFRSPKPTRAVSSVRPK